MAKATLYTREMIEKYTREGWWEPMTLSDYWDRNARDYPHKEALVDSRVRLTWAQAKTWVDRLALGFLELGLKKDQTVVIQLPSSVELLALRIACERAGLLNLPVLRTFRHTEMEHVLKYTEAEAVVIPWKLRDFDYYAMVQELRPNLPRLKYVFVVGDEVPPGAISIKEMLAKPLEKKYPADYLASRQMPFLEFSFIGLTTGTTGVPKFVEIPVCSRVLSGRIVADFLKLTPNDTLAALTGAAMGPNVPPYWGGPRAVARVVLMEHWSAEEGLKLIEREKVTIPCVVPAMLAELNAFPDLHKYDLSSVRAIWSTGAMLAYHMALEIEGKLKAPILNDYGAVDFGGFCGSGVDELQNVRLLTVGHPQPGNEIKLVDASGREVPQGGIGEIIARGPQSTSGYYKDPETTARTWSPDGWYRTGDLGKFDERGCLSIAGREKDMIIRGGQNIYPLEVENFLLTHPKIANVAIVGVPDPIMGEKACVCVVAKPGQQVNMEEIVSFLRSKRIAAYKLPEKLMLLDALPYVGGGLKLDRKTLQANVVQQLKARGEIKA